jgi:inhibitor of cysteine peptidase
VDVMTGFRSRLSGYVAAALVLLTLAACRSGAPDAGQPVPRDQAVTTGQAPVKSVEIVIMESFPVQVAVVARGELPDVCTEIDQVNQRIDVEDDTLWVEITTVRPTDLACIQVLAPFEERIPLDVYGLPAGTYTVDVNGVTGTFTLSVDNVPPEE